MLTPEKRPVDGHGDSRKTSREYWEHVHRGRVKEGLPSRFVVPARNVTRLLARYVRRGTRVLEIGFAPGKILLWLGAHQRAEVSGLDYSRNGVETARRLFSSYGIAADLRCEDLFQSSFPRESFDIVYSLGVIEHFEDPREAVLRHFELVRPGGTAVLVIPNYGGVYGRLQRLCNPENLAIHNLGIMTEQSLAELAPNTGVEASRAFRFGRFHLALVSLEKRLTPRVAKAVLLLANAAGVVQPLEIGSLCPAIVLEIRKSG